ncbi:Bug family tripartite tricarboxylate transporter substrate binding protein [Pseudorhodoferax soli]|uniref:Tripartite-type tricarboxylate transporter receptor subunit TctC n=1 Tax=Pseudorhodoferax soli TaxID=545864 RepID=A0A368XM94_9BURK|nr:tripartite tricarboxylate transporter substrate binding protein [Pseudorhodoferax soli]RCW68669.1 tripartite-type tricarboxylate transporter receptor subunit TctC [Pseudorhodoferax soli]
MNVSVVRSLVAGALATMTGLASVAAAAEVYPAKPIQLVVPFSAGGDADQSARNLAASAADILGQPMIVVNKAGGNGIIGSQYVKAAKPDGYTLLLARTGPQILLPALQPQTTGYAWNDFTFLGLLDLNPVICAVHPDSPFKNFQDLVAGLQAKPGKLSYSHPGVATVPNLTPQLVLSSLGLPPGAAINVPYKGGGEAVLAVMSREVDFSCGNLSSMMGNLTGGKLRPLITTTPERLNKFPNLPTAREAGFPQLEAMLGWSALYGPPNMSTATVNRWVGALQRVAGDARWIAGTQGFGGIPRVLPPADTEKFVGESFSINQRIVRDANLKLE